jgi:hypothetical protein
MRLDKGLSLINNTIQTHIKLQAERAELIKGIANIAKNLEGTSLSLDQSRDEKLQKSQKKNIEILQNIFDKQYEYTGTLKENIEDQLKKYSEDVAGLKEIYERKEKLNQKLLKLKQAESEKKENVDKDIKDIKMLISTSDAHLLEEIQDFKNNREKDLLLLFKKFFKNKFESTEEVYNINKNRCLKSSKVKSNILIYLMQKLINYI